MAAAYQPRWTKGQPGGSELLDRNLREIAEALASAFGTINDLRTTIVNITATTSTTTAPRIPAAPPGFDGGDMGDVFGDLPINVPGRDGTIGRDGRPGFGMDGDPGEDGTAGPPGVAGATGASGAPGTNGISNVPGPAGPDGDDGMDGGARMDFSGMPLGALPGEINATGDVKRSLDGDSTIRGDGFNYYSRVVVGTYTILSPAVLTIEDNGILMVL